MPATADRPRLLRRLAWITLLLLIAVTCLSAYLRHRAAGLGCAPWPPCFGQGERAAAGAHLLGGQVLTWARLAHRITASLALLFVIAMVVVSLVRPPRLWREGLLSSVLLALALLLALLGLFTPGSRLPAVAIGNLLGGFAMLAIAACLVSPPSPRERRLGVVAIAAAGVLAAQMAGGALVSASHAGLACSDLRECFEQARAGGFDWRALWPWREAAFAVGTPHVEGALAQLLHRAGSGVAVLSTVGVAWLAHCRGRRREAVAVLGLLACVVALGLVAGSTGLPLAPVLLHNLGSAGLLALVLRLA